MKKVIIGISGSSGAVYADLLLQKLVSLKDQWSAAGVVASKNARVNWRLELGTELEVPPSMTLYGQDDFNAPFASGSARYDTMILCPCSMGTLGRIAHGISDDLLTRAADVILKEKRRLILVPRETPLSLIHLRNMTILAECGAHILPAIPSFYTGPASVKELLVTVVDRALDLAGFELEAKRWGD